MMGLVAGATIIVASAAAWSDPGRLTAKAESGPIYNQATKSYFELRHDAPTLAGGSSGATWGYLREFAERFTYKGVRGRLAVIDGPETMEFLQKHFEIKPGDAAWIGLRMFCHNRKLVWVNGDTLPRSPNLPWKAQWHLSDIRCTTQSLPYMPVMMSATPMGYRWQATGPAKRYTSYLVEYPTGTP